jgi:restriction system protein
VKEASVDKTCPCQSEKHDHPKGACPNPPGEAGICKKCRNMTAADQAMAAIRPTMANFPQPIRRAGLSPAILAASSRATQVFFQARRRFDLSVASILISERVTNEGVLIRATTQLFDEIARDLGNDWSRVLELTPEQWEHLVGGYLSKMGYEVVITSRSGDFGRDLIARKPDIGAFKLLGSVKRYARGRPVPASAARELMGVLSMDRSATKGLLVTTSDFAPQILRDPGLAKACADDRLELINGVALQKLLTELNRAGEG